MSKENIVKFQDALAQKPELSEKLKVEHTLEDVVAAAQAEGFDFTVEELKASARVGKLADEELDGVAGGRIVIVTVGYGCTRWKEDTSGRLWLAVKGNCGSCRHYDPQGGLIGLCLFGIN